MIRLKHNDAYHTIASTTRATKSEPSRCELDCGLWVDQPVTLHTGAVRPEELCPGCDKVRMLALEYFATQVEARAR